MSNHKDEEKLTGGNVSNVYRLGNTVRRDLKPESYRIHGLLKHLENKRYPHAPRFLGIDKDRREILTYVEGEAGNYPIKEYMWSNNALKEIAKMLRLYHDAVSDFSFDETWQSLDNAPANHEVLCHNDFAIYNIIFKDKNPVAIIDFDNVGPGPRLWDIAYTLYTCVPLSRYNLTKTAEEIVYYDSVQDADRIKQRVKLFFEAYGEAVAENYLEMVVLRLEGLCKTIVRKASEGDLAFQKMITEGHVEHYQNEVKFILEHAHEWT
ncbi:phosphotransferase [Planococcus soli]|uniref:phosphotransferase n=1 Tax=Planococcus soli TaxID=2666072 RepID=UPI00115CB794|nr:aminoglycoside phosphotransferase family protein [Planococcus soli]